MPAQLSLHRTNNDQRKMLDHISDGQWYTRAKMISAVTNKKSPEFTDPINDYIDELNEGGYMIAGENSSFRLKEKYVQQWRKKRGHNLTTNHEPRYFGKLLEDDGWLHAPLRRTALVHFRADSSVDKKAVESILAERMDEFSVSIDEAGLIRVIADEGALVYRIMREAGKERPELRIKSVRLNNKVFRRNLEDLPPRFFQELCEFYGGFSKNLLKSSMSSITAHIQDHEDIQQQIYLWIIDAVERYDEKTSIPFAAYLATMLKKWVHNLNRSAHGRSIADSELKHVRAITKYETEHGRRPTNEELAHLLGESVDKVRADAFSVSVVSNLRSTTTLNSDDFTVPLIATETSTDDIESDLDKTVLTVSLLATALDLLEETNGKSAVAFFRVVDETWNHDRRLSPYYRGVSAAELEGHKGQLMEGMRQRIQEADNS